MERSFEQHLLILRDFFGIYLRRAQDLAKAGQKDEARDWLRYFENSEIISLLSDENLGVLGACERKRFQKQLADLRVECHPQDVPDYRTDLQAIRGELSVIRNFLGAAFQKPNSDSGLSFSRTFPDRLVVPAPQERRSDFTNKP